jgi:ABC-2 type transport system permease protein
VQKIINRYRYSYILLKQLVKTDFKLRYRNSILGYMWSLLRPLFLFAVLYVVFVVILKTGGDVPHFGTYLLLGLVVWNYFVETTTGSVAAIVAKGDLIRKIYFPRYVIILAHAFSALINIALNFIIILFFMWIAGAEPNKFVLLTPLYMFELFLFAVSISFLLSALYVKYRDINFIWEVITQMLFYATPILYAFSFITTKSEPLAKVLILNPLAQVMQDMRYAFISDKTITAYKVFNGGWYFLIPFIIVIVTAIIGMTYFRKQSKSFAENV